MTSHESPEQYEGPIVRDRRRLDPETGELREPQQPSAPEPTPEAPAVDDQGTELETQLAERTADLQRLQAEYVNYKRRVDRDRGVLREAAVAGVLTSLLPVLDDIDRARQHGQLDGGFRAVAESLEKILAGQGLQRFGAEGDPFDPYVHEALTHAHDADAAGPTVSAVLQPGYRVGERVVRPARVAVVEPPEAPPEEQPESAPEPEGE